LEILPSRENMSEPWLRGTLTDVPAITRAVLHSLQLAREDLSAWCEPLSDEELNARPAGVPSIGFQLRHLARSLDRLLTYAEGRELSFEQLAALQSEANSTSSKQELLGELAAAWENAACRLRSFDPDNLEQPRTVGKLKLLTTLGGLLVHIAEHTQRHTGQTVTTAKIVLQSRSQTRDSKAPG
jgi:uncharacterized damage-inducible protein DinB